MFHVYERYLLLLTLFVFNSMTYCSESLVVFQGFQ